MKQESGRNRILAIYGYTDYAEYLRDFYHWRKEGQRGYSYRSFSKDAGFSSPNVLKLVMEGQRRIGDASVERFIQALGLTAGMAEYFRVLVKLQHAKSSEEKHGFLQQLTRLTPHEQRRQLNPESVEFLSHWLYPVLREMVELQSFRDDPLWISRRLVGRCQLHEITRALQFLKKHGFIEKCEDGRFRVKDAMVLSSDEIKSLAVRQFHKSILQQSQQMLDDLDIHDREFGALIVRLPEQALDELKQKLKSFRHELHRWALDQEANDLSQIVQVNFQMYPQMRKAKL